VPGRWPNPTGGPLRLQCRATLYRRCLPSIWPGLMTGASKAVASAAQKNAGGGLSIPELHGQRRYGPNRTLSLART
jgi:hypothetical protein